MRRLVLIGAALMLLAGACGTAGAERSAVRTIELTVRHSRFEPESFEVPEGSRVRFVIRNLDPIDHELIVGDAGVHERHENGTEPFHPPRPGEVTVPAGQVAATTYTFDVPGTVVYACHLPGHFAYGMRGAARVTGAG
jgi:uncharacterized cupredoxin-like copper-binding protein